MPLKKILPSHKGFSLLELLIVILIISGVYFLGFSGFEKPSAQLKPLTPLNLKTNILKSVSAPVTLLCTDKCRNCYLSKGKHAFTPYKSNIDLENIQAYTLDSQDALLQLDYGRYKDHKICLLLDFYQNQSSTQVILKNEKGVYFLPAFFGEPQKVASLDEAKDLWLKNSTLLTNRGDFY